MFTSDKEEKQLLSRAEDALRLSELRRKPYYLGFLNEKEQFLIRGHLSYASDRLSFFGGYEGAQRTVMRASAYEADSSDYPIVKLCYKFRASDSPSHRDFLGALMGLGIERDCVGDIIVSDGFAAVFVKDEIRGFVESELTKVGRIGIRLIDESECDISFDKSTELKSIIVSSLRLDAVVAAVAGMSRDKAASTILSGRVFVNYSEAKKSSLLLKPDDILTVRGCGKYIIKEQSGSTKKGRLKISVEHYI